MLSPVEDKIRIAAMGGKGNLSIIIDEISGGIDMDY